MESLSTKVRQSQRAPPRTVPRSYIDLEFPPCDESINKTIVKSLLVLNNGQQDVTTGFDRLIHWRRPIEYMNSDGGESVTPKLFPTNSQENTPVNLLSEVKDITKGHLHHDWLICAIICLLEKNEQLITRLFETKQYND